MTEIPLRESLVLAPPERVRGALRAAAGSLESLISLRSLNPGVRALQALISLIALDNLDASLASRAPQPQDAHRAIPRISCIKH